MKIQFGITNSTSFITWQRVVVLFILMISVVCSGYGQEQDDYSERDYGTLITNRNDPFPTNKQDSIIIPCRKAVTIDDVFYLFTLTVPDVSQIREKPFEKLTAEDKEKIISTAWQTADTTLLKIVFRIAFDTAADNKYIRKISVECLSKFNIDSVKKVLTSLLKDKDVGMISALSLVQLGQREQAFQYILAHYTDSIEFDLIHNIGTALMRVNNPEAIKLLKKISEHKDPSEALDALAALSLLGYCNFAYQGFCRYTTSNVWQVRTKVANCLLYYTGTPEALTIVKNMYQNEKDHFVVKQFDEILKRFNIKY